MKRSGKPPLDFGFHEFKSLDDLVEEVSGPDAAKRKPGDGGATDAPDDAKPPRKLPSSVALRLNNNFLSEVTSLESVLPLVVRNPADICWIDLSFNQLERIDRVFAELPNLQRLYLHANQIRNLTDVDRLQQLTQLRSLTLHGNPIQENKLYRMYIISTIPWLRTLDFSAVTRKDLDIAITWRQMTLIKKKRRQTAAASAEAGAGSGGGAASGDAGS